jgi:putative hydroxymethylpyrimidine transport system substrate-binding protein
MRILLTAVVVAVALLAGCGDESSSESAERPSLSREPREVRVSVNRYVGPEHAGLLMAEANGYFADVGLEVILDPPSSPMWPIRYLLSELVDSDLSISHEPQVAISVDNGHPIVAVGSLISEPTAALIWLQRSEIERVSDLKGKTIAVPGLPFQVGFLESILLRSGLKLDDVNIRYVDYGAVPALVSGRADAIFGGSSQLEGVELRSLGREPVITPVKGMGIPPYEELVLVAPNDLVSKEPQLIHDFMAALSRGTAAAVRNPRAVVREIEVHVEPSVVSSRKAREAQVKSILPLLSKSGYMNPDQGSELIEWMHREGMIQEEVPVSSLLTNDYLPHP